MVPIWGTICDNWCLYSAQHNITLGAGAFSQCLAPEKLAQLCFLAFYIVSTYTARYILKLTVTWPVPEALPYTAALKRSRPAFITKHPVNMVSAFKVIKAIEYMHMNGRQIDHLVKIPHLQSRILLEYWSIHKSNGEVSTIWGTNDFPCVHIQGVGGNIPTSKLKRHTQQHCNTFASFQMMFERIRKTSSWTWLW